MTRKKPEDFTPTMSFSPSEERRCDLPGCAAVGQFRAPRSHDRLTDYFWFCLDHVRSYNASWNYYADMNQEEMERQIRFDVTWWRPTWPFGAQGMFGHHAASEAPPIDFGAFAAEGWTERTHRPENGKAGNRPRPGSAEEQALAVFDLDPPVTVVEIKARYKSLVKRHHPDANGGDKDAEERLKLINEAYATLKHKVGV